MEWTVMKAREGADFLYVPQPHTRWRPMIDPFLEVDSFPSLIKAICALLASFVAWLCGLAKPVLEIGKLGLEVYSKLRGSR
jgi:hypothetical protein